MSGKTELEEKRISAINTLKLLAILIVFNSHCDALFPISVFATGGAIGNSLFFIVSGYLLSIKKDDSFLKFIWKKVMRIYPAVYVTSLINAVYFKNLPQSFTELVVYLIWPTRYWFVGAILLFYFLIWGLKKIKFEQHILKYSTCVAIIFLLYYLFFVDKTQWSMEIEGLSNIAGYFKCIHYFYIFSIGYFIKVHNEAIKNRVKTKMPLLAALFIICFWGQLTLKYCMNCGIISFFFQFVIHIIDILCAVSMLLLTLSIAEDYEIRVGRKPIQKVINCLSSVSLEIYFMQFLFIDICIGVVFPINIMIAFISTGSVALLINVFCRRIEQLVFKGVH